MISAEGPGRGGSLHQEQMGGSGIPSRPWDAGVKGVMVWSFIFGIMGSVTQTGSRVGPWTPSAYSGAVLRKFGGWVPTLPLVWPMVPFLDLGAAGSSEGGRSRKKWLPPLPPATLESHTRQAHARTSVWPPRGLTTPEGPTGLGPRELRNVS